MLNKRQQAFAEAYLKTGVATSSYISAGYSPVAAAIKASQLLCNPKVKAYLAEKKAEIAIQQAELAKKNQVTTDWLVSNAKKVLEYSIQINKKTKLMVSPKYAIAANEQIAKLTGLLTVQQDTNITIQIERAEKQLEVLEDFSDYQDQIAVTPTTDTTAIQPNLQLVKVPSTAV